jgi:hypothetical protein
MKALILQTLEIFSKTCAKLNQMPKIFLDEQWRSLMLVAELIKK